MNSKTRLFLLVAVLAVTVGAAVSVRAISPTDDAVAKWKADGVWDQKVAEWQKFKADGGCAPNTVRPYNRERVQQSIAAGVTTVDTIVIPVILVDFPDLKYDQAVYNIPGGGTQIQRTAGRPGQFDTLLFSFGTFPTGSMTDFYWENSYHTVFIKGLLMGWYTMPQNYSYYVGNDDGLGMGGPILVRDAINTADSVGNDFSVCNGGQPGTIPGVIVVHAGPGAEAGAYGIWSHKSSPAVGTVNPDGQFIISYTLNPEEFGAGISTVGVFCHEYGHVMGMPDLYDVNQSNSPNNDGLGRWSLMAGGSWNGPSGNGGGPASFDAWCKSQLGFTSPVELTGNLKHVAIPTSQLNPASYWLWNTTKNAMEYWLVENREQHGLFDTYLPGSGLCIYHYDGAVFSNDNPDRLHVALEQADGLFNLEGPGGSDAGDPYPGTTNNRNFTDRTIPDSRYNSNDSSSQVGVWNISNADSVMYADLDVRWSRPYITMKKAADSISFSDQAGGDNDGVPEPGETIAFNCKMQNSMLLAGYGHVHMSANNLNLTWVQNDVRSSVIFNPAFEVALQNPIRFSLPSNFLSANVTFTMTMKVDSSFAAIDSMYTFTYTFTQALGRTQILVVDDDNDQTRSGFGYQKRITDALDRLRLPYDVWTKTSSGSPAAANLTPYKYVIWITGPSSQSGGNYGGTITANDVTAMKGFLDNHGGLLLSGVTLAQQLRVIDVSFMNSYLHATSTANDTIPSDAFGQEFWGVDGAPVCGGSKYQFGSSDPVYFGGALLIPVNGGVPELIAKPELAGPSGQIYGMQAVSYSGGTGGYQTFFMSTGLECLNDGLTAQGWGSKDTLIMRVLNFFAAGQATDVEDNHDGSLPSGFALAQNYPNPFNPTTTINYTIAANDRPSKTTLEILNMLGQRVTTLVDKVQSSGSYSVTWDGTDVRGRRVASGTYFYRLISGEKTETKKMVLLK